MPVLRMIFVITAESLRRPDDIRRQIEPNLEFTGGREPLMEVPC